MVLKLTPHSQTHPKSSPHDLISSLNAIRYLAKNQISELKRLQDEEVNDMIEYANAVYESTVEQSERILEMIRHFRSGTKDSSVNVKKVRSISIREVLDQILRAMHYEFPFRNITLLKILPHDLANLKIREDHLVIMLFQLIYNARQSIGRDVGLITVEAEMKDKVSPEDERDTVQIRVSDTGLGFSAEQVQHLFDAFYTARDPRTTAGLGLYVVKRLIEVNGGLLRVERSASGTSFFIELPTA